MVHSFHQVWFNVLLNTVKYIYGNGLVVVRADIETSFIGKSGAKVEKNWQNAAHFHWVLKSAVFSETEPEDGGSVVRVCAARMAVERRGIGKSEDE